MVYALIFGVAIFGEHYTAQTVLGMTLHELLQFQLFSYVIEESETAVV